MYPGYPTLPGCTLPGVLLPTHPRVHQPAVHYPAVHGSGHADGAGLALTRTVTEVTVTDSGVTRARSLRVEDGFFKAGKPESGRTEKKDGIGPGKCLEVTRGINQESSLSALLRKSGVKDSSGPLSSGVFVRAREAWINPRRVINSGIKCGKTEKARFGTLTPEESGLLRLVPNNPRE